MSPRLAGALTAIAALAIAGALGAAALLWSGWYDVAATDQHYAPTYRLLDLGMRQSIKRHARKVEVPALDDAAAARGVVPYAAHCVQCHGAPGVAPEPFALGLTPLPANLAHTARKWTPAELFRAVKFGIKMTGMPAWGFRLTDDEIWAVVALMRRLPGLTPQQYAALRPLDAPPRDDAPRAHPDAQRGRLALEQYGCVMCHSIPGVVGPSAPVGPTLAGIGARAFVAGSLANTADNMARWIREPQAVRPGSAMPDLGVGERDARDIAAYLGTLREGRQ